VLTRSNLSSVAWYCRIFEARSCCAVGIVRPCPAFVRFTSDATKKRDVSWHSCRRFGAHRPEGRFPTRRLKTCEPPRSFLAMPRKHTASFILELPMKTDPADERACAIILDAGRNIGSAVLGEGLRRLDLMRESRASEALKAKTKYCRIIRRDIRGRERWYVQLVQEGLTPLRRETKRGVVGPNIGPSTIAAVAHTEAIFEQFCPSVIRPSEELRRIKRAMDRSKRANNPECFDEKGRWKRAQRCACGPNAIKRALANGESGSDAMRPNASAVTASLPTALTGRDKIPAAYPDRATAQAGGLMSYGTDGADMFRHVGVYAGNILKGAKPADLPVQQSTKFEFVINRRTAKALGLEIPVVLRVSADLID
jgi:hypothetical protein